MDGRMDGWRSERLLENHAWSPKKSKARTGMSCPRINEGEMPCSNVTRSNFAAASSVDISPSNMIPADSKNTALKEAERGG